MKRPLKKLLLIVVLIAAAAGAVLLSVKTHKRAPPSNAPSQISAPKEQAPPPPVALDTREGVVTLVIPGGFGLQREDGQEVFIQVDENTSFTENNSGKPPKPLTQKDIKAGDKVSVVSIPDQGGLRALTVVLLP